MALAGEPGHEFRIYNRGNASEVHLLLFITRKYPIINANLLTQKYIHFIQLLFTNVGM